MFVFSLQGERREGLTPTAFARGLAVFIGWMDKFHDDVSGIATLHGWKGWSLVYI